jgi:putative ABC transport system permease protein
VKIITRAYAENMDQLPNDLAILGVSAVSDKLAKTFPDMTWVKRIRFGGLIDVPDEKGETRSQGPAMGLAMDLLTKESLETDRLNLAESLIRGRLPRKTGEILISDDFAIKLGVEPGDTLTIIGSTMYGSMAMQNYVISGTVRFGVQVMDRGAFVIDLKDAQLLLDMEDASGEMLGYYRNKSYDDKKAGETVERFKLIFKNQEDEFSPVMLKLKDQNELAGMLDYMASMTGIFIGVFLAAMSIVLWNSGLLGGLRRYGEVGVRLAFGEPKGHVYRSMIMESVFIGLFGSVVGTIIGLIIAYYFQVYGMDLSAAMKNATIMMPSVFRTQITPPAYFVGLVPGLLSTVLGTALAGIGIYQRKTAQLFKELEQ